jgi:hypothetical protein
VDKGGHEVKDTNAQASKSVYSKYVREIKRCPEFVKVYEDNIRPDAFPLTPDELVINGKLWPEMTKHLEVFVIGEPCALGMPVAIDPEKPVMEILPPLLGEGAEESVLFDPSQGASHTHRYEEIYLFSGTDPDDPEDLGGEIELWLGLGKSAEKFMITKSTAVIMPPGLPAGPVVFRKVNRPILWVVILDNPTYGMIPTGTNPPGFMPEV